MRLPARLRTRLLIANLIVAFAALGSVLLAVSLVGPGYFADAMGHRPGDPAGQAMDAATLAAFQDAVRTALLAATGIALIAAVAIAIALATRIAGPVTRLAGAAHRVAAGHYAERVPPALGEIGDLATSFNSMAGSLEATERRRMELVGDVAHELRTPIATLDGYLEGLEDGVVPATDETWRLLRHETARLARLVTDLQELWRAEAKQLPLRVEPFDAGAVLADVAARFEAQGATLGVEIEVDTGSGGPVVARADRERVMQIADNYLSNALRYAPAGSTVVLRAERRITEVVISVRDAGRGLTPDQLTRVFERFYRADRGRSRIEGGSGIGLAIAHALADAMGGRAWAVSDGPGTGSTFLLALPADD
jgi:two-component system sensor histidine kinase BaeS